MANMSEPSGSIHFLGVCLAAHVGALLVNIRLICGIAPQKLLNLHVRIGLSLPARARPRRGAAHPHPHRALLRRCLA
jgi:hypothetical protein